MSESNQPFVESRRVAGRRSTDQPAPVSGAPDWFKQWADELRRDVLTIAAKEKEGQAGTGRWWASLPQGLRCYILSTVEPDNWDRYLDAPWSGLSDEMRASVALQCKQTRRALGAWEWF